MKKILTLILTFTPFSILIAGNNASTGDIQFVQNNGQWQEQIGFSADIYGGKFFVEKNCFTWSFTNAFELSDFKHNGDVEGLSQFILKSHAFKTNFIDANQAVKLSGENKYDNYYNFFLGSDEQHWKSAVPAFEAVRYQELYNGIDLLLYSLGGSIKYDLIVQPNVNAEQIRFSYEGLSDVRLVDGNLELITSINTIVELKPVAWQIISGQKIIVPCTFNLNNNELSFSFPAGYDPNYELVIDPATLIFASYSGSTADNWGYSATYDILGNLYGAGITFANGYPVTLGAYQETWTAGAGSYVADVTISKFSSDGTSLIYSTYLGGSNEDLPYSMIVDDDDNLIVYGATGSSNFPVTAGCYDNSFNGGTAVTVDYVLAFTSGSDGFVAKFNPDGTDLIGSTYFGGTANDAINEGNTAYNYGDHARGEVNMDPIGQIYIASCTNSSNLPVTAFAFQTDFGGDQDGFIAKFNPELTDLIWCSFVGGSAEDGVYNIQKITGEKFVICGGTSSEDFPTTEGALNENYLGGTTDGFAMIISSNCGFIIASTFIGTDEYDQAFLVEIDEVNSIYVTGQTLGDYPVVCDVYENVGSTQYITKLDSTLSSITFSTVFGSGDPEVNISPTAFLVDECQHLYVAGWGGATNSLFNPAVGTVDNMPISGDAFQSSTDGSDFYLIVLSKDASELIYGTYFGGPVSDEHVDGGTSRFDPAGIVYEAVCAGCGGSDDFPTTDGVVSNTNNSTNCNLGVFKFQFTIPPTTASIDAEPLSGCLPLTVDFTNNSVNEESVEWNFGTGDISTEENPSYTFSEPGTYTITLIAHIPFLCGVDDTAVITVEVYSYPEADFSSTPIPGSVFTPTIFTDLSTDAATWFWEFGDGATSDEQNPEHQYILPGIYEVCLTVETEFGCQAKVCDSVEVFSGSLLDIPNAFSPNGDNTNDEFLPINYGITEYEFKIYNRWGELIFQTSNPGKGWDGTFKGVEQELDVYIYVITGKGFDNSPYYQQGNVTLVR